MKLMQDHDNTLYQKIQYDIKKVGLYGLEKRIKQKIYYLILD